MTLREIFESVCDRLAKGEETTVPRIQHEYGVDFVTAHRLVGKLVADGYAEFDGKLAYKPIDFASDPRFSAAAEKLRADGDPDGMLEKIVFARLADGDMSTLNIASICSMDYSQSKELLARLDEIGITDRAGIKHKILFNKAALTALFAQKSAAPAAQPRVEDPAVEPKNEDPAVEPKVEMPATEEPDGEKIEPDAPAQTDNAEEESGEQSNKEFVLSVIDRLVKMSEERGSSLKREDIWDDDYDEYDIDFVSDDESDDEDADDEDDDETVLYVDEDYDEDDDGENDDAELEEEGLDEAIAIMRQLASESVEEEAKKAKKAAFDLDDEDADEYYDEDENLDKEFYGDPDDEEDEEVEDGELTDEEIEWDESEDRRLAGIAVTELSMWTGITEPETMIAEILELYNELSYGEGNEKLQNEAARIYRYLREEKRKTLLKRMRGATAVFYDMYTARAGVAKCDMDGDRLMTSVFQSMLRIIRESPDADIYVLRQIAAAEAFALGEAGGSTQDERRALLVADNTAEALRDLDGACVALLNKMYVRGKMPKCNVDVVMVTDGTHDDNNYPFAFRLMDALDREVLMCRRDYLDISLCVRNICYGSFDFDTDYTFSYSEFYDMPYGLPQILRELQSVFFIKGPREAGKGSNGLEALAKAVRSDWRAIPERGPAKRIIVVVSKRSPLPPDSGTKKDEVYPSTMEEYKQMWEKFAGEEDGSDKLLFLVTPNGDCGWNALTEWRNVKHAEFDDYSEPDVAMRLARQIILRSMNY